MASPTPCTTAKRNSSGTQSPSEANVQRRLST